MNKILTAVLLFAALAANAQTVTTTTCGGEPPRRQLRPHATLEEAAADASDGNWYIVPLKEWRRSEEGGKTRFTAEFVNPASWLNRQILVRTESASSGYTVEIGGTVAGSVRSGSEPAEFNITKLAKQGINTISVILDNPSSNEPLLRSDVAWLGLTEIVSQPTIRVRDIDSRTTLNDAGDAVFEVAIVVKSDALNAKQARISYDLWNDYDHLTSGYKDVSLSMRGEDTVRFVAVIPKELLWSSERPTLLDLVIRNRIEGRYAENIVEHVGVREVKYEDNTLKVNGKEETLRVRTVAPNLTVEELRQIKESGCNAVTVEAGEAAAGLYAACDAAGVYVIPQLAVDTSNGGRSIKKGGNAGNDPSLTAEYLTRTRAMYHRAKSHPSVVAFSLGNGVANGINTYESYLLIKGEDSSRPVVYVGANKEWNNDPFDLRFGK